MTEDPVTQHPATQQPGFDDDNEVVNRSGNRPFGDVLDSRISRRDILVGGLAVGVASFLPAAAAAAGGPPQDGDADDRSGRA
ncbi:MAG: hypothetical protein QNJ91_00455, partial [Gammaproteobacteria bacterium]|nr:hypothetical protein [Gammaproteobacteria bacterium]